MVSTSPQAGTESFIQSTFSAIELEVSMPLQSQKKEEDVAKGKAYFEKLTMRKQRLMEEQQEAPAVTATEQKDDDEENGLHTADSNMKTTMSTTTRMTRRRATISSTANTSTTPVKKPSSSRRLTRSAAKQEQNVDDHDSKVIVRFEKPPERVRANTISKSPSSSSPPRQRRATRNQGSKTVSTVNRRRSMRLMEKESLEDDLDEKTEEAESVSCNDESQGTVPEVHTVAAIATPSRRTRKSRIPTYKTSASTVKISPASSKMEVKGEMITEVSVYTQSPSPGTAHMGREQEGISNNLESTITGFVSKIPPLPPKRFHGNHCDNFARKDASCHENTTTEVPENCFPLAGKPEVMVPYYPPPSHLKQEKSAEEESNKNSDLLELLTMSSTETEGTESSIPFDAIKSSCNQESSPKIKSKETVDGPEIGGYGESIFRTCVLCILLFALLNVLSVTQVDTSKIYSSSAMAVNDDGHQIYEKSSSDSLPSHCFSVYYDVDEKTQTCTLTPLAQAQNVKKT
jgi:hypothetical protein